MVPANRLFRDRLERRRNAIGRKPDRRRIERRRYALDWIPLFRNADPILIVDALAECEIIEMPEGTHLLTPGRPNDTVYIPLSGQVSARLNIAGGAENSIAIPTGECVGELSAIDGKPVSALVQLDSPSRILRIPREIFWNRLMTLPAVARNLQVALSERLRSTNEIALKAQREQLELQHLRKELGVAHQLQTSMLPLQRPMFPERSDVEVCGLMEPASSVGGDLFDAFFLDDERLFFCIGDVSGHGIASALFMARVVGLLRLLAISCETPDELLFELNNRLCVGNDANIFVTLFCGVYDTSTGDISYSNGGHCAPWVKRTEGIQVLPLPKGPLIGAIPGARFSERKTSLAPGEFIFCYTDGVTEAQLPSGEEFGEARCEELLTTQGCKPLPELLDTVRDSVAAFTLTRVLDDDCTMLAVRRALIAA